MWDVAGDEDGRQNQIARMRLLPGCSESTILGVFVGKPTTESSLHSHYGSDSGCNIPISHVIPTNWPVRISLRVGLFTTAYRCGPEVCFGEVTWTGCRHIGLVPSGSGDMEVGGESGPGSVLGSRPVSTNVCASAGMRPPRNVISQTVASAVESAYPTTA